MEEVRRGHTREGSVELTERWLPDYEGVSQSSRRRPDFHPSESRLMRCKKCETTRQPCSANTSCKSLISFQESGQRNTHKDVSRSSPSARAETERNREQLICFYAVDTVSLLFARWCLYIVARAVFWKIHQACIQLHKHLYSFRRKRTKSTSRSFLSKCKEE